MADQRDHQYIVGVCRACDIQQRLLQMLAGGLRAGQGHHVRCGTAGLGDAIQIRRQRREALLVVRLAAEACDTFTK